MEKITLISHADLDGLVCVSLLLKKFYEAKPRIYFTSANQFKKVLALSIANNDHLNKLFISDIAATQKTLLLSSVYDKVVWIDHHEWEKCELPLNVEVVHDPNAPSASQLVAKYLGIESDIVNLVNEVDRDEVKSTEAEFLRDLVGAIRWKYKGKNFTNKLISISKTLCFHGIEELERSLAVASLIDEYSKWLSGFSEKILQIARIVEKNNKKIAVCEINEQLPPYFINSKLKQHPNAPFDIILIIVRKLDPTKRKIFTRIEFRTHTAEDVYSLAKQFNGGGHKVAAAATLKSFLSTEEILEKIA